MKKSISLLLSLLLLVGLLAGCAGTTTTATTAATTSAGTTVATTTAATTASGEKRKLVFWNINMAKESMAYFEKEFPLAYPDIELEMTYYASEDYKNQTRIAAESDSMPDVYTTNAGSFFWEFVDKGLAMDLTTTANERKWFDRADKGYFDVFTRDSKLYGMPCKGVTVWQNLYYNKDILAANSIEVPKNMTELVAACAKLSAAGVQPIAMGNKDGWPAILLLGDYMCQFSTYDIVHQINAGTAKFTDQGPMREAVKAIETLAQNKCFMNGISSSDHTMGIQTFAAGKAGFLYNGSWWPGVVQDTEITFEVGVAWLPRASADGSLKAVQMSCDMPFVVNDKSPNKSAAVDLLDFLSDKPFSKAFAEAENCFAIYPGLNKEIKLDPLFNEAPIQEQFQYPVTGIFMDWSFPVPVITVMKTQLQLIIDGKTSVDAALVAIDAEMQKNLSK